MIESLMLMALGFFIATLFAMIAARLVWRRAVTVTERRFGAENGEAARSAELDALLTQQRREVEPLHNEIAALTRKNEALQGDTANLRARLEDAYADVAARDDRLAALAEDLGRIGAALTAEARRQDETRNTLKNLSDSATRLAGEIAPAGSRASEPQAAQAADPVETADADRRTLAAIAASINRMDDENWRESAEKSADETDRDSAADAVLSERALAARIRALEAGVAS